MNAQGLIIGAAAFLIIGAFHPIVVKTEYHFGTRAWPLFLLLGLSCLAISTQIGAVTGSAILGVLGFSFLWGIRELFEQAERVKRGWFPRNPRRQEEAETR